MKRIKKMKHFALALAAILLLSNANYVHASELAADTAIQANGEIDVASTVKTFSFPRNKTAFTVGMVSIFDDSTVRLIMPRNNGNSLVQGTLFFIPISGGNQITRPFANYSTEELIINVPSGAYMVKIEGAAVGTSAPVSVTLVIEP